MHKKSVMLWALVLANILGGTAMAQDPSAGMAPQEPAVATEDPTSSQQEVMVADPAQNEEMQAVLGTVLSVDRDNKTLIVQDREGREIGVAFAPGWHVYRRGQEINYRDVEPNDVIQLHYRS